MKSPRRGSKHRKAQVLVVDDHPIVREGLIGLINRQRDMACCADAGDFAAAQEATAKLKPDIAILDLRLGASDGLDLIKTLRTLHPDMRILVLSQLEQTMYAERALRAGAHGFVMKEQASDELLGAIRTVLAGELYVARGVALNILRSVAERGEQQANPGIQGLTNRELHVLQLVGAGLTSKQIAGELHLSTRTVETYREKIKHKLGLPNGNALTRFAATWSREAVTFPRPDVP
jgi:DNA-binding NarL/FixJ family response regulator